MFHESTNSICIFIQLALLTLTMHLRDLPQVLEAFHSRFILDYSHILDGKSEVSTYFSKYEIKDLTLS